MKHSPETVLPALDKVVVASLFVFIAFSMFSISITQIAAGIGGIAWLLRTHISKKWHELRLPLGIPFLLFALACLAAVADAHDMSYSYKSLKKLLEVLVFFWVVNCVYENRLRDALILLLIASATLAGLFGFYQAWENPVTIGSRVEGTMSIYMTFAGLLMIVGMLALGRVLFRRPVEHWLWVSLGVIAICLLLTLTRQAWLGFLAGALFLFSIKRKKVLLILPVLFIAGAIVSTENVRLQIQKLSPPKDGSFTEHLKFRTLRIFDGKDETLRIRLALWQGGWEIFKDHPLTGCGFRCVDLVNSQYPDPTGYVKILRGMHNNIVQLAVDTGIFGLTTWLGIWICFFRLLHSRNAALERDPSSDWIVWGSSAGVVAFLAGGFFESNYYDSEVVMVLYFIMALPFAGSKIKESAKSNTNEINPKHSNPTGSSTE